MSGDHGDRHRGSSRVRRGSCLVALPLAIALAVVVPLALASPPDPVWVGGDSDAADAADVVVLIVSLEGTVEWCSLTGVLARLSRPLSVRRDERRAPSSSSDPMRDSNGIQPSAISVPGYSSSTVNSKH